MFEVEEEFSRKKIIEKGCPVCEYDAIMIPDMGIQCTNPSNDCSMGKVWWMKLTWKNKMKETGKGSIKTL